MILIEYHPEGCSLSELKVKNTDCRVESQDKKLLPKTQISEVSETSEILILAGAEDALLPQERVEMILRFYVLLRLYSVTIVFVSSTGL